MRLLRKLESARHGRATATKTLPGTARAGPATNPEDAREVAIRGQTSEPPKPIRTSPIGGGRKACYHKSTLDTLKYIQRY